METLTKIEEAMVSLKADVSKFFDKDNNSAGTRARKTAQEIKALLQQLRVDIIAERKAQD